MRMKKFMKFNERENEKIFDKHYKRIWDTMNSQAGDWDVVATDSDGYQLFIFDITFEDDDYKEHKVYTMGEVHRKEGVVTFQEYKEKIFKEMLQGYKERK
jgi:hypothetical protein